VIQPTNKEKDIQDKHDGCRFVLKHSEEDIQSMYDEVWSYSRINTYVQCPKAYEIQYIQGYRGNPNVYSYLGGLIHDIMEKWYNGVYNKSQAILQFEKDYNSHFGIYWFPNDKIRDNWYKAMHNFFIKHEKSSDTGQQEVLCLYKTPKGNIFRGFIDRITDDTIIDWKTSSMFSGKKLLSAGRQLILYKLAVEQECNVNIDKVAWCMMKYNNMKYYDVTPTLINETKEYLDNTVDAIHNNVGKEYECKYEKFFCENLCSVRNRCPKKNG